MVERRPPRWRPVLAWVFLLLFAVAAPVAVAAGWARTTLRNEAVYAQAARNVAGEPRVQAALATLVTGRIEVLLVGENPTAGEAILYRQIEGDIADATRGVLASEEFGDIWEAANRGAHQLLTAGFTAGPGQPVVLDLSPLQEPIAAEIERRDIELPPEWEPTGDDLRIQVLDAALADRIRLVLSRLDLAFAAAVAAALISLVLTIGLAPDRLAAIARSGFALALGMVVLIAAIVAGEAWLATGSGNGGAVIAAILDGVSQGLRLATIALALAGLVIAGIFAGLAALRRSTVRRRVSVG